MVHCDRLHACHSDVFSDPLRCLILCVYDSDDSWRVEVGESRTQARSRCFRRVATPPELASKRVAELDLVSRLEDAEADVSDHTAGRALDDGPRAKPVLLLRPDVLLQRS